MMHPPDEHDAPNATLVIGEACIVGESEAVIITETFADLERILSQADTIQGAEYVEASDVRSAYDRLKAAMGRMVIDM
jgi:hypothetical protein